MRIKMKETFKIIKPNYVYLRLTPNNSIRNQSTYKIARAIASLYKSVFQRIRAEEKKLVKLFGREFLVGTKYSFNLYEKVSFFIYMEKKKLEFYFIVPDQYISLIEEKMSDVWSYITVKEVKELPRFNDDAGKYHLVYEKEDALSLDINRNSNELLRSNLNVINILDEGDKVGLFYNFIPTNQRGWRSSYKETINKFVNKQPVERNKFDFMFILKYSLIGLSKLVDTILGSFTEKEEKQDNMMDIILNRLNGGKELSGSTQNKENATILKTQMLVISESNDRFKMLNNMKSVAQSFETVSGDNKLIPKRYNKKFKYTDYKIEGAAENMVSDNECNSFISLAGRDILEEYNFVEKIETKESQVPDDLMKGKWRLGVSTYRGNEVEAYLSEDKEYKHLSLFLIGPSRAGKTTLIGNLSKDAINNNECVILFDFIENCEMSTQVAELFSQDKVLNIVCDSRESAQGLGYNEIRHSDDPEQQYINAKMQATQLSTLINSINVDDAPLTSRMRKYLMSAALVVFLTGKSIREVFIVLQNHKNRHECINDVHESLMGDMQEYIDYLYELDEKDKEGVITGTRLSAIEGIINRLNLLKDNPYMEIMLKKNTDNNIDLVNEIEKNKLICIKMPESMFNTDEERDVYCIYWITKIWLSLQIRAKLIPDKDKRRKVNLFIDEMYQVQNTEQFISEKLSRFAKFRLKPIISCHYLGQLKHIKKELAGANASYMLIAGSDENNFKELENQLKPFSIEDLINLKEYHSLNLIKNKGGYGKFITRLPKPVGETEKVQNNCLQAVNSGLLLNHEGKHHEQT